MVGKPAGRLVQLVAGNAQVQQSPVDRRDGKFREHARRIAEIRLYHPGGQALEPFGGGCHRIRVLVERDQLPGGQAFCDLHTVPCPTGGPIEIDTSRVDGQPVKAGLQQHGYVRKFHLAFYLYRLKVQILHRSGEVLIAGGLIFIPCLGVPDLGKAAVADDGHVVVEPCIFPQLGGQLDAALLVRRDFHRRSVQHTADLAAFDQALLFQIPRPGTPPGSGPASGSR